MGRRQGTKLTDKHKKAISAKVALYWARKQKRDVRINILVSSKCLICEKYFIKRKDTSKYCSVPCRVIGVGRSLSGKKLSNLHRLKLSKAHLRGEKHPMWKGGVTPQHEKIRRSMSYKLWRKNVFERDGYKCVLCNKIGGKLNADHILPFSLFPEFRLAFENGRTLCVECHRKTPTWGNHGKKLQRINFINVV